MNQRVEQVTRVAAYGVIVHEYRILLCRLSGKVPQAAGKWTLPGGGVEFGEHPEATVVREVDEETGLTATVGRLAHVDSRIIRDPGMHRHNIRILYYASVLDGEMQGETNGTTDGCAWFHRSELPELVSISRIGVDLAFP